MCSLKVSPPKHLLFTKWKKNKFLVDKPSTPSLDQGTKDTSVTIIQNATTPTPCHVMNREGHNLISVVFLQKMHSLNLIMRKLQRNPNRRTFNKISGQYTSKRSRVRKTKTEELSLIGGQGHTAARCRVGSGIAFCTRKRTFIGKLRNFK